MNRSLLIWAALAAVMFLSACGNRGPLVLPTETNSLNNQQTVQLSMTQSVSDANRWHAG